MNGTTASRLHEALATTEDRSFALELLVDRDGVLETLERLALICHAKSDHIDETWQDAGLADVWTRMGRRIGSVVDSEAFRRLALAAGERAS